MSAGESDPAGGSQAVATRARSFAPESVGERVHPTLKNGWVVRVWDREWPSAWTAYAFINEEDAQRFIRGFDWSFHDYSIRPGLVKLEVTYVP